jgi:hypothetical protein
MNTETDNQTAEARADSLQQVDMLRGKIIAAAMAWYRKNLEEGYGSKLWDESWKDERALHNACAKLAQKQHIDKAEARRTDGVRKS